MLKKLLCVLCLVVAVGSITGCHAAATTDKGHGAAVDVG